MVHLSHVWTLWKISEIALPYCKFEIDMRIYISEITWLLSSKTMLCASHSISHR